MFFIIYKTTNIINGKTYTGKHQTKNLDDGYLGSGKLLQAAIKKYGKENFHREILHFCKSEKHMNVLEKILVVPDIETNYNLCAGGKGGFGYINEYVWTKEKRKIIGEKGGKIGGNKCYEMGIGIHSQTIEEKKEFSRQARIAFKEKYPNGFTWKQSEQALNNQKKRLKEIEHQQGPKNSQYGTRWIHSIELKTSIKVKKDELIPQGWFEGRKMKF